MQVEIAWVLAIMARVDNESSPPAASEDALKLGIKRV